MTPERGSLANAFLASSSTCSWVVTTAGGFRLIHGDSMPVFGKPAAELLNRSIADALDPDAAVVWRDRFDRVAAGERQVLRERRGSSSVVAISLFRIELEGELYIGGSAHEIGFMARAEQELRYAVHSAIKAQEFDRRMVARFLHDKIGQNLTALGLQLDLVRMDLETAAPATIERLTDIQRHLEAMMEDVRNYSYELNPSTVERAGLRAALDRMVAKIKGRYSGAIRINADPSLKLDPGIASAMYQIAQEAVENAIQHSGCSSIQIAVKSSKAGAYLEIRDNGRGFDPADIAGGVRGLGLLGMEYHAAQAGLDLSIKSSRRRGTAVRAATVDSE
jgi:signal transduction histidine kinase